VSQQESLTKELRKQQKSLKNNMSDYVVQRGLFDQLFHLLQCKLKLAANSDQQHFGGQDIFSGAVDIAQFDVGGAVRILFLYNALKHLMLTLCFY